jgi:cytidine deaminase
MLDDEMRQRLIETARQVRHYAYAPYSNYSVGAALLTASGKIYDGVNVENASYPSGICAERNAAFKAVSEGEREFVAVAVVTPQAGSMCGGCRQVLSEFGPKMIVLLVDAEGKLHSETTLDAILPNAFGPDDLSKR